jgi:hypothetical protein
MTRFLDINANTSSCLSQTHISGISLARNEPLKHDLGFSTDFKKQFTSPKSCLSSYMITGKLLGVLLWAENVVHGFKLSHQNIV